MKDDIFYTTFTEHTIGEFLTICNYIIRYDGFNYEVYTFEEEYYKHLRNYDKLSEAIKRISEELEKEGK